MSISFSSGHNPNRKIWQNLWINLVSLNASLAAGCGLHLKLITCNNFASSWGFATSFFSADFWAAWWAMKKILEKYNTPSCSWAHCAARPTWRSRQWWPGRGRGRRTRRGTPWRTCPGCPGWSCRSPRSDPVRTGPTLQFSIDMLAIIYYVWNGKYLCSIYAD